jgi:hypothetical protein
MNKPTQPRPPFEVASPPYELDGYGWAMAQAALLRAGRFDVADWGNIIEEIESVGKRERSTVRSALRVLMMHILKWQHQPERRSRSWALSIASQRLAYQDAIRDNPSLKAELDILRAEAHRRARLQAADETDLPLKMFSDTALDWHVILEAPFEFPEA